MATTDPSAPTGKTLRLSLAAQNSVKSLIDAYMQTHTKFTELHDKMDAIDVAYARYQAENDTRVSSNGVDQRNSAGNVECGNVFGSDKVTPPIVVSQVDTYVAYLADVFLSGSPIFPVVSNPSNKQWAEQLETLLDDHATLGGYSRELLLWMRDGVKYNYSALEADWTAVDQFSIAGDFSSGTGRKVAKAKKGYTAIRRLDPRNVFHDMTVAPAEISKKGDYAGYIEYVSRTKVKIELNKLTEAGEVYNADLAFRSEHPDQLAGSSYYRDPPRISNYISQLDLQKNGGVDWAAWFEDKDTKKKASVDTSRRFGAQYERVVTYARIIPSDMGITAPQPNHPQIWKFVHINGIMITAKRIISAYDYLPILFGQPMEDGLGYQTQSAAEGEIEFQDAAAKLFNIRFAAARRAVSDRAIYDSEILDPTDVNSTSPAPKIPARISSLSKKKLGDLYFPIPFDQRGLENVIQDAQAIVGFSKELHGANSPRQGQFQKGNKSVVEWNDTMAGSDNRMRMPAMVLEVQAIGPLKSILTLNVFQYGEDAVIISQKNGAEVSINIAELREKVLAFRVGDGFTPKSKLASTEAITGSMQLLASSPILQQAYGSMLPSMFMHLNQLLGIRGMEEYDPSFKPVAAGTQNLDANSLQPPVGAAPPQIAPPQQQLPGAIPVSSPPPAIP